MLSWSSFSFPSVLVYHNISISHFSHYPFSAIRQRFNRSCPELSKELTYENLRQGGNSFWPHAVVWSHIYGCLNSALKHISVQLCRDIDQHWSYENRYIPFSLSGVWRKHFLQLSDFIGNRALTTTLAWWHCSFGRFEPCCLNRRPSF